jgi:hypothetical protein
MSSHWKRMPAVIDALLVESPDQRLAATPHGKSANK